MRRTGIVFFLVLAMILPSFINPGIKAAEPAITAQVHADAAAGKVTVTGIISWGEGQKVSIIIVNPAGGIDYVDQTTSSSGGSFAFSYTPVRVLEGTYAVKIGNAVMRQAHALSFAYDFAAPTPTPVPVPTPEPTSIPTPTPPIEEDREEGGSGAPIPPPTPVKPDEAKTEILFGDITLDGSGAAKVFTPSSSFRKTGDDFKGILGARIEVDYKLPAAAPAHRFVVCYVDKEGKLEVVKNGIYDPVKGKLLFHAEKPGKYTVVSRDRSFEDIREVSWAVESIEALAVREVLQGMDGERFKPEEGVTRAQFVKMLVSTFGLEAENAQSNLKDVTPEDWYHKYVASAQSLGLVHGYEDGTFGGDGLITRQEMASLAYRAVKVLDIKLAGTAPSAGFKDFGQIDSYARDAVNVMQQADIIKGMGNGLFEPGSTATRAQAAKIVYGLLVKAMTAN